MRFVYHPELVEQVVFLAARRNGSWECELHEHIDRLYATADPELRNQAFRDAYAQRFSAWGLGRDVEDALAQLPTLREITQCVIVPAGRGNSQRVDLLSKEVAGRTERTLYVQLRPETVLDPTTIRPWLRRELLHVVDMLDEKFGYRADEMPGSSWERKLRQDRYMVLWRMYIAGRLTRAGYPDDRELSALRTAFGRAFIHQGAHPPTAAFERVLHADSLTHAQLLAWAIAPQSLVAGESACAACGPQPGGSCPLCGFPTHDWFDFVDQGSAELAAAIETTHAAWNRVQGACRQCAETYAYRFGRSAGGPRFVCIQGEEHESVISPQRCLIA